MRKDLARKVAALKESAGFKTETLAEASGVPEGTINKILNGETTNPTARTLRNLAAALDTTLDHLLGDAPAGLRPIEVQKIPFLGPITCGEPTFPGETFSAYVQAGSHIQADFALRAVGDSMVGARIYDGDIVFVRQQEDVRDGEIAVVILDEETTLKRVYKFPDGTAQLRSENPKYPPIHIGGGGETRHVRILGRAIAFQGDVV
jgi:repressor LexA